MTEFVVGRDIFSVPGDLYVVTVNTVGVMGAGVAKAFKELQYDLYCLYRTDCRLKNIQTGKPVIYHGDDGKYYMMFPTKQNWRNPSEYLWIEQGLYWMVESVGVEIDPEWTIIIPPLGCGHGGLNFKFVAPMIKEAADQMPNKVVCVYPPWLDPN